MNRIFKYKQGSDIYGDTLELSNRLDDIISRYNNRAQEVQLVTPIPASNTTHFSYTRDVNADWVLSNDKINDRLVLYASSLNKNLKSMLNHYQLGHNIHDIDYENIADYQLAYLESNAFIQKVKSGYYNGKETDAVSDLRSIAIKADADPSSFVSTFSDYLEKGDNENADNKTESEASNNLKSKGFTLDIDPASLGYKQKIVDYLKSNNIKLAKGPNGLYYAFDSNYTSPVTLNFLNSDWLTDGLDTSSYNHGIFTDANGKVWSGNIDNAPAEYSEAIQSAKENAKTKKTGLYTIYDWYDPNNKNKYNELIQKMSSLKDSKGNPVLTGLFADVSKLFDSGKTIIAVNPKGQPFKLDSYGNLRLDDNTYLYFKADNGNVVRAPFKMIKGSLIAKKADKNFGNYNSEGFNVGSTLTPAIDNSGLPSLEDAAKEAGYSDVELYLKSLRRPSESGWSAADIARMVAIGEDIGSLLTSFTSMSGYGALASFGLGVGSSLTNFGADWAEDGLLGSDFANLGKSLLWDIAGVIPGAKAGRVAKSLSRILFRSLPTVMGIILGLNNKDEYKAMINKLLKGESFTVRDWQLAAQLIKMMAGIGRSTYSKSMGKRGPQLDIKNVATAPVKKAKLLYQSTVVLPVEKYRRARRITPLGVKQKLKSTTATSSSSSIINPGLLDEVPTNKQGGKLDRFGEYLKSHK